MELEVSLGSSHGSCGCRGCGRVFTSLTGFDRHQRQSACCGTLCLDPAAVGLELKRNGRWGFPARNDQ